MNIKEILEKNEAYRDIYYQGNINPYLEHKEYCKAVMEGYDGKGFPEQWEFYTPEYRYLRNNWKNRVKQNCIGLSLTIAPQLFYVVIDQILTYIMSQCPYFDIEYIGIDNGGVKFVINNINPEIREELDYAQEQLWDYHLLK